MSIGKDRLYLLLSVMCIAGYLWLGYHFFAEAQHHHNSLEICMFKHVTNTPCPACGSTRSAMALMQGNVNQSLLINPLGAIVLLIAAIAPLWIGVDLILKKDSLHSTYLKIESILEKPAVYIPLILLVVANWIWNIQKGL